MTGKKEALSMLSKKTVFVDTADRKQYNQANKAIWHSMPKTSPAIFHGRL